MGSLGSDHGGYWWRLPSHATYSFEERQMGMVGCIKAPAFLFLNSL